MNDSDWKMMINSYINEISHYSQKQVFATSYYQRNYFQHQIDDATSSLINLFTNVSQNQLNEGELQLPPELPPEQPVPPPELPEVPQNGQSTGPRIFTREELAMHNGRNGMSAYVAINGTVYDVSAKLRWSGGTHFGLSAGKDLSRQYRDCHAQLLGVLNGLPVVGILQPEENQ